jgi:hypothetical protein
MYVATARFAALAACGAGPEPRRWTDQDVYVKSEEAWQVSWERIYDARTHLFYDQVWSYDPEKRLASLPTPEEIHRQFPNRNGWGTGMEDCAIGAGVMMSMICERFEATRDASLRRPAEQVFAGMVLLGTLSPSEGFVIRGVCPVDQRSHYCESSRDQYMWYMLLQEQVSLEALYQLVCKGFTTARRHIGRPCGWGSCEQVFALTRAEP